MKPGDAVKITGGSLTGQTATLLAWDQHHQLWVVQLRPGFKGFIKPEHLQAVKA